MVRQAHALLPAGDDDGRVARLDRLHAQRHGAHAAAADLVDAPRRGFLRDAGVDRGLSGGVLALRCGQHLTEDHLADLVRADAGLRQRRDDHGLAQVMRRDGAQRAHEAADGGALGRGDDDSGHGRYSQ